GFLTPAFLAGLALLAIPVLVHLTNRPRSETVPFPSLMFLQRIPYRSVRRQSLRHWLLFAMRCLAFVLLALAFARPFFGGRGRAATVLAGAKVRVVLLDRSYSMGYAGRWARALEAARRAVSEPGPQDRVALVLFDRAPESSGEPSADRAAVLAALAAARPGFGVTRYAPALRMAQETLDASLLPRREIVLVTDFQKAGWEGADDVQLPPSTTLTWVDVSDRGASNLAVTGVEMERDYESGRERVKAAARLVNKGPRPVEGAEVTFDVDGRTVRQQRASLGPNTSATVTFEPFPLPPAVARATVRVTPDALAQDDAFHFVLAPGGDLPVLILENGPPRGRTTMPRRPGDSRSGGCASSWRPAVDCWWCWPTRAPPPPGKARRPACSRARWARPSIGPRTGERPSPISTTAIPCSSCSAARTAATSRPRASSAIAGWRRRTACSRGSTTARWRWRTRRSARATFSCGPAASTPPGTISPFNPSSCLSSTSSCAMRPATRSRRRGTPWGRPSISRVSPRS
ncbi:MAG: hypothetical protein DMF77_12420, partial [Acidobacteria bacterium]